MAINYYINYMSTDEEIEDWDRILAYGNDPQQQGTRPCMSVDDATLPEDFKGTAGTGKYVINAEQDGVTLAE